MSYTQFAALVVALVLFAAAGYTTGKLDKQSTIVEECKNTGMYLDRNLLMVCKVGTPVVVPKPDSL